MPFFPQKHNSCPIPWQCQPHPLPCERPELGIGHLWIHYYAKVLPLLLKTGLSLFSREAAQSCVITAALMFVLLLLITGFPKGRWDINQEGGNQRKRVVKSRNKTKLKEKNYQAQIKPKRSRSSLNKQNKNNLISKSFS